MICTRELKYLMSSPGLINSRCSTARPGLVYRLATLIGVKTAGRLVATSAFKVGFGYRVVLPVAAYFTLLGTNIEGRGVQPDIEERFCPERLWDGQDTQLTRAQAHLEASVDT